MAIGGCQMVDLAYQPRAYQVNLGTQNVREDLILLNVARASRFEPMNFTALSKYTATGQLQVSGSALANTGVNSQVFRGGGPSAGSVLTGGPSSTLSAGGAASTNNSFDIASLDNQEFYANFLAPLTPEKIHILVNAGLSRDIVFHSVVRSVKVKLGKAGEARVPLFKELRYNNDPSDDKWFGKSSPENAKICEDALAFEASRNHPSGYPLPPFASDIWRGDHLNDCNYSKFLRFIKAGLEYGLTTEVIPSRGARGRSRAASDQIRVAQLNVIVSTDRSGGDRARQEVGDVKLCFDESLAALNKLQVPTGSQYSSCRTGEAKADLKIQTFAPYIDTVTPVLQSPYSVFQYYGLLVRTGTAYRVSLTDRARERTADDTIFRVTSETGGGCYSYVSYSGRDYCVPQENAANTKEVLTLLVALVNLSTSRQSLPVTPTVLSNP
jgi:hypothetical protein